jgi:hypothetical protein
MDGIIFFSNESDHPLARFLKPGFRHCWCAVREDQGFWTAVDGREGRPGMSTIAEADFARYLDRAVSSGATAVSVTFGPALRTPILIYTCVSVMKAIFGIRSFAVTPHQLYRALVKREAWSKWSIGSGDLAGLGGGSATPERATAASVPGQAARAISEVVSWQ